jgi:hypothetical protein
VAKDPKLIDPQPGLAGGPQPSPPGVSDGAPRPVQADPAPATKPDTPQPKPGEELDGEGLLAPGESGTPGGVPGRG